MACRPHPRAAFRWPGMALSGQPLPSSFASMSSSPCPPRLLCLPGNQSLLSPRHIAGRTDSFPPPIDRQRVPSLHPISPRDHFESNRCCRYSEFQKAFPKGRTASLCTRPIVGGVRQQRGRCPVQTRRPGGRLSAHLERLPGAHTAARGPVSDRGSRAPCLASRCLFSCFLVFINHLEHEADASRGDLQTACRSCESPRSRLTLHGTAPSLLRRWGVAWSPHTLRGQ